MDMFPKLKTGAAAQFGSSREVRFHTKVLRFVDGTEQRIMQRRAEVQWNLELDQLSEEEVRAIADFFHEHQGSTESFRFEDPWTGESIENCVFADDELEFQWLEPNRASTSIRIRKVGP